MIRRNRGYLYHMTQVEVDHVPEHTKELSSKGYTVISALSPDEVQRLRDEIDHVFETITTDESIQEHEMFRHGMLNKSELCQQTIAHPAIRNVVMPLLGADYHVIANTAWRQIPPTKNERGQLWHCDGGPHIPLPDGVVWPENIPHPVFAIGVHIFLMDCPLECGPTGVLPCSHLSGRPPPATYDTDLEYMGSKAVPLIAKAGDIAFFVSDVWHRRLPSTEADTGRYFLQVHFGRRDIAQRIAPTSRVNHLSPEAQARAESSSNPFDRTIVGLHQIGFYDS